MIESGQYVFLSVSCRNLKNMDFLLDKSDPFVKVSVSSIQKGTFMDVGRTQVKYNELNPNFDYRFRLPYFFERVQYVRFQVIDEDSKNPANNDYLGSATTTMSQLMGADMQTLILELKLDGKPAGKLIARCEAEAQGSQMLTMEMQASKLVNTDSFFDFWDKSDPYLKLIKVRTDKTKVCVYTSQVVKNNLSPTWRPITVSIRNLVSSKQEKFVIECWDHEDEDQHQFIGSAELSVQELMNKMKNRQSIQLKSPKYSKPGMLMCSRAVIAKVPKFLDFLRGGLKINMACAIDFTGSNKHIYDVTSLHYLNPSMPNQYQKALFSVSEIVLHYSPDQRIPAYGFGAQINKQKVSHCFNLSLRPDIQFANGIGELMGMYTQALPKLNFSGPTYFQHILRKAIQLGRVNQSVNEFFYLVLLIMTDGLINDMSETIQLIFQCAALPISIIIVGVGNCQDFKAMNVLDGDSGLVNKEGRTCPRDLVQFVPFKDVGGDPDRLRQTVLAQLPSQIEQYYRMRGVTPKEALTSDVSNLVQTPSFGLNQVLTPMVNINVGAGPLPPGFGTPGFVQGFMQMAPPPGFGLAPPGYAPIPSPGSAHPPHGGFDYPMQSMVQALPPQKKIQ